MSFGVGCRCGLDLSLLWLCHRLAAAALIQPLAWELPHASSTAVKTKKEGVPVVVQWLTNPTRNHEVVGFVPGLAQWVKDLALL